MKNNDNLLFKISNNKILLFLIPNLICWYQLFYYYNQNVDLIISVLFYEIIVGCIIFLGINTVVYFLLHKFLKNRQKVFCIMCVVPICYFIEMNSLTFIMFLIVILVASINIKYLINFSLDNIVGIISFVVVILFSFTFVNSIYNLCYMTLKSKSYDYEIDFDVDVEKDAPNVYWIHCDAMMNSTTLKKYFGKSYEELNIYFEMNDYYYNNEANLDIGHSTTRALTAMFNPYYYDEFYQEYLIDLEKKFLREKENTDFIVNYYELEEKRINNELFQALGEKGYETVVIGDFNPHIAFYPDYYYDYYHYLGMGDPKRELRYFEKDDNSDFMLKTQLRITHSGLLFSSNILNHLVNNTNILNYKSIDYNSFDFADYTYTKNTDYWYSKAVFKGIEDSYSKNQSKFTFIDYKLNHYPLTFFSNGQFLMENQQYDLNYYYENYVYSCKLLFELLDYIKTVDKDAVIIVQGDHGINTFEDDYIMQELDIREKELQEVRNSVINAIYVPKEYRNGDEEVLGNPLNISRYLVNSFVGENYEYVK